MGFCWHHFSLSCGGIYQPVIRGILHIYLIYMALWANQPLFQAAASDSSASPDMGDSFDRSNIICSHIFWELWEDSDSKTPYCRYVNNFFLHCASINIILYYHVLCGLGGFKTIVAIYHFVVHNDRCEQRLLWTTTIVNKLLFTWSLWTTILVNMIVVNNNSCSQSFNQYCTFINIAYN